MFYSPLEQFQIYPLFFLTWKNFDISFTNSFIIIVIGFLSLLILFRMILSSKNQIYFFPKNWQIIIEIIYSAVLKIVIDNIGKKNQNFFPFIFVLFLFLIVSNVVGLIPYSFTITSHLIITIALAISIFIGINIICLKKHKINILTLFLPSGTSFKLAFILIPIEIISYIFKPLSLAVRLFANMMAGHTLLKIIVGLTWIIIDIGNIFCFVYFIPITLLIILFGLELGVAFIQTYVFTLLVCIYLNDVINLH
jgi:ATP synthase subunit 6